jgi:hypothetical protein
MGLEITAELSSGSLSVSGTGFEPGGTVTIQITNQQTDVSYSPQTTADGSGGFSYSIPDFCSGTGGGNYQVSATNGEPQPGAGFNYEWSNNVPINCPAQPAHSHSSSPNTTTPMSSPPMSSPPMSSPPASSSPSPSSSPSA